MTKAIECRQYCKTFDRGDYKYLNKLVLLFLGEESRQLHCRHPRVHYEARF